MKNAKKVVKNVIFVQVCFLFLIGYCSAQTSLKREKPLWELGLFTGAIRLPHYLGSDEYKWYVMPLPYLIYRGEIFQCDRNGARGIFAGTDRVEFNISLFGNPPVFDDNKAREGMSDLDAIFEVGPALKLFFTDRGSTDAFYLRMALRGSSSVGFDDGVDIKHQGFHGSTNLIYNNQSLFKHSKLKLYLNAGLNFSDRGLNAYFYDVPENSVTSDRGFYESDGGYAGFSMSVSMQKTIIKKLSFGGYCRWDNVDGAVFEDSPLVREKNNFVIGFALIWKILKSKRSSKSTRLP